MTEISSIISLAQIAVPAAIGITGLGLSMLGEAFSTKDKDKQYSDQVFALPEYLKQQGKPSWATNSLHFWN